MALPATPAQPVPDVATMIGGGNTEPRTDDPAWQPPKDPLADGRIEDRARIIHRQMPMMVCGTGWDVPSVRNALSQQTIGLFDLPAQMIDEISGDSRVQAGLGSRIGGVLGRPVDFMLPAKYANSEAARECRQAFAEAWPTMAAESFMYDLQRWAVMLGFGVGQVLWDFSGDYAIPRPLTWHPRFTYWHWTARCMVATTQDGLVPIVEGNGNWILHAPKGAYRGWMHGADRAIAPWWLARHYALRDWSRYSERHGLPMIKAKTPARGDPDQIAAWRSALMYLGQETVIQIPQSVDPGVSYDVDLLEAKDTAHDGFRMLISQCDNEITLALLFQNLTTDAREGSHAAARVHADVRQAALEADARALEDTIYRQLARPFAALNFGNADLAPRARWNVKPYEDDLTAVQTLSTFAMALNTLRLAGFEIEDASAAAKGFGLDIGKLVALTKGAEIYQYDLAYGIATINEARGRKGLPPIEGGDVPPGAGAARGPEARSPTEMTARFAAVAAEHARLRIALGQTSRDQIEAETAAMVDMLAAQEQRHVRRARR